MNTENAKAQMRKGILEYCILLILSKEFLLCKRHNKGTQGSKTDSGGRDIVSTANTSEECRIAQLPLGRIAAGAAKEIL